LVRFKEGGDDETFGASSPLKGTICPSIIAK